jgi:hypothetical protein
MGMKCGSGSRGRGTMDSGGKLVVLFLGMGMMDVWVFNFRNHLKQTL